MNADKIKTKLQPKDRAVNIVKIGDKTEAVPFTAHAHVISFLSIFLIPKGNGIPIIKARGAMIIIDKIIFVIKLKIINLFRISGKNIEYNIIVKNNKIIIFFIFLVFSLLDRSAPKEENNSTEKIIVIVEQIIWPKNRINF